MIIIMIIIITIIIIIIIIIVGELVLELVALKKTDYSHDNYT